MISVAAVVYDTIVLNIPEALRNLIAKIEIKINDQQTSGKASIIFTASIMDGNSHGQQMRFTIPQRNITAIDKSSAYFVQVSDHRKIINEPCRLPILHNYITD